MLEIKQLSVAVEGCGEHVEAAWLPISLQCIWGMTAWSDAGYEVTV